MGYDLEIERVKAEIKSSKAKKVLIQMADGLKPKAAEIAKELESTGAKIFIWGGSCFGACDLPDVKGFDLLVHFGHSAWKK